MVNQQPAMAQGGTYLVQQPAVSSVHQGIVQQPAVHQGTKQPQLTQQVQVQVPAGAVPGSQFQVTVRGKIQTVMVPQGAAPGTVLTINA